MTPCPCQQARPAAAWVCRRRLQPVPRPLTEFLGEILVLPGRYALAYSDDIRWNTQDLSPWPEARTPLGEPPDRGRGSERARTGLARRALSYQWSLRIGARAAVRRCASRQCRPAEIEASPSDF